MASDWQVEQRKRMLAAIMLLALLAVADGVWLTHVHVNLTVGKPGVGQVCHALSKDGCSVTAGEYGSLFGVPVALIGAAGALSTFVVALVAYRRRSESYEPFRVATFVLAMVSVLASVIMGSLSAIADSFCPFCVGWYGLNLGMGVCAWLATDAADRKPIDALRKITGAPLLPMVATFSLSLAAGIYAESRYMGSLLEERDAFVKAQIEQLKAGGREEVPLHRMQTRGPEDAAVVIVEVADFQCPFCRKLWKAVDGYKAKSGRAVRTGFVHYPLDNKCNPRLEHGAHEFACEASMASECAGQQGKFFEYGEAAVRQPDQARPRAPARVRQGAGAGRCGVRGVPGRPEDQGRDPQEHRAGAGAEGSRHAHVPSSTGTGSRAPAPRRCSRRSSRACCRRTSEAQPGVTRLRPQPVMSL